MRKVLSLVVAATALSGFFATGAQAVHCDSQLVIFSRPVSLNSNALVCAAAAQDTDDLGYDGRIINPGSDAISIRYTTDLGADIPTLTIVLNGLGFTDEVVIATRAPFATGDFVYDTPVVPLPGGPTSSGTVTADAYLGEELLDTVAFHTLI